MAIHIGYRANAPSPLGPAPNATEECVPAKQYGVCSRAWIALFGASSLVFADRSDPPHI
jgi:hypothetical protein